MAHAQEAKSGDEKLNEQLQSQQADLNAQDVRVRDLEKQLKIMSQTVADQAARQKALAEASEVQAARAKEPPPLPPVPPAVAPEATPDLDPLRRLVITGYLQSQLEAHQDSEDQVRQGGTPLNQNRFLIRRARLKVEREWEYSSMFLEIDGNTNRGPSMGLQHAEASLLYRGNDKPQGPPVVKLTMGLFDLPYGYELLESPRVRPFMERSLISRAFFPAEPDLGARLSGELGFFRYSFAAVNGESLGTPSPFVLQDPNNHKDIVGRVGAVVAPVEKVKIIGGVSFLNGKGFHRGNDATKNNVQWKDANEDGILKPDNTEVVGSAGSVATPSESFERWAVGLDLRLRFETVLGETELGGELYAGSNMDRALFVADPLLAPGIDSRELGFYAGLTQQVTRYGLVGFRTDYYNPNADFRDQSHGKLLPAKQTVRTFSPIVGLTLPDRARLLFQYDFVRDFFARDAVGVPTDLSNDQFTLRLQVQL